MASAMPPVTEPLALAELMDWPSPAWARPWKTGK